MIGTCRSECWVRPFDEERAALGILRDRLNMRNKKRVETRVPKRKKRIADEPDILSRVITADESWLRYSDPLTKRESRSWKSPDVAAQEENLQGVYAITFFRPSFTVPGISKG